MQCIEEDGILKPFTRDTFSSCIKATYCEIDNKPYKIYKNPKEGGFKKSQKGCCVVLKDSEKGYIYKEELTWEEAKQCRENELKTVFLDGKLVREENLQTIRDRLHEGQF